MQATRRIACLAVALLVAPVGVRAAESEAERFQALEERMRALEDKLAASNATIQAQQDLLSRAAPDVAQGQAQGSSLDEFFRNLEVGGFVTGSYLYNFNHPDRGFSSPQPLNQFNRGNDEFSFDAAKIEIGKTAANPGDAGFRFELLYGQNAAILREASPTANTFFADLDGDGIVDTGTALVNGTSGDSDMELFVQEAYASYNLNGVTFKLGKFETLLGYEVLDSHKNPNVTHGVLFTWAIPLYHTGLLASGSLSENVTWSLGITDGFNNVRENNDGKAALGQIAFTSGPWFASLSGFWGGEANEGTAGTPGSTDDFMIADAILSFSPSDATSFWVNADLGKIDDVPLVSRNDLVTPRGDSDPYYWGVAVGARTKLTDKLGFAIRGEYLEDQDDVRATNFGLVDRADVELWSLTGTLSYAFTQNLLMRGELRWDHADSAVQEAVSTLGGGKIFPKGSSRDGNTDDESLLGIVEVSYIFD